MAADTLLREVEEKRKKALEALDADFSTKSAEIKRRAEEEKLRIQDNAKRQAAEARLKERRSGSMAPQNSKRRSRYSMQLKRCLRITSPHCVKRFWITLDQKNTRRF